MTQPHLTDADVQQYLQDHPDFFKDKDELLVHMHITHNVGSATSLIERQLSVHRARNTELRQRLSELLENARHNDQLFAKTRRLVLALTEADSWVAVQAALDDGLRRDFGVDSWALLHLTERQLEPPLLAVHNSEAQRQLLRLFKGRRALCGQLQEAEMAALLGQPQTEMKSIASAQIRGQNNNALLSVASRDANYYRSSMDTLFLDYLADVLALRLAQIPVNK